MTRTPKLEMLAFGVCKFWFPLSKHDSSWRDPAMWGCVQVMSVEGIDATARAPLIHSKCVPYNVSVMRVCWLVWNRLRRKQCFVSVSVQSQNLEPQLGPIWEQLWPKLRPILASKGGHSQPNPKSWKCPFSLVFSTFFCYRWRFVWSNVPHVVSPLGRTWCENRHHLGKRVNCAHQNKSHAPTSSFCEQTADRATIFPKP